MPSTHALTPALRALDARPRRWRLHVTPSDQTTLAHAVSRTIARTLCDLPAPDYLVEGEESPRGIPVHLAEPPPGGGGVRLRIGAEIYPLCESCLKHPSVQFHVAAWAKLLANAHYAKPASPVVDVESKQAAMFVREVATLDLKSAYPYMMSATSGRRR